MSWEAQDGLSTFPPSRTNREVPRETMSVSNRPHLTTEAGAPVADNQHSQTAGVTGPVLLQDHHLLEKLARFNRERIPERVVHAVGSGAYGHFEVTNPDISRYTRMKLFSAKG